MPQARKAPTPGNEREGNRWVGDRPTPVDFSAWFKENVRLDDALGEDAHKWYVGGIVLISGTEKRREVDANGRIVWAERLVHTPYPKVETREAYFWDVCDARDWLGAIEPVAHPTLTAPHVANHNLPPGFFRAPVINQAGGVVDHVGCTMRVTIHERIPLGTGRPVRIPPPMNKTLPSLTSDSVDPHLLMKCETGAIGRALGAAGMLIIPGSGLATAEDITDLARGEAIPERLPGEGAEAREYGEPPDLRGRIAELASKLESDKPGLADEFAAWLGEKGIRLEDIKESQLRPVLLKLEKLLG